AGRLWAAVWRRRGPSTVERFGADTSPYAGEVDRSPARLAAGGQRVPEPQRDCRHPSLHEHRCWVRQGRANVGRDHYNRPGEQSEADLPGGEPQPLVLDVEHDQRHICQVDREWPDVGWPTMKGT